MCKTSPCFPDPAGALKLIQAGFKDKLTVTIWKGDLFGKEFLWPVIAPVKTGSGCIFLKNDLCELHDKGLKPMEGRLAYHKNVDYHNLRKNICFTWVNQYGIAVMKMFEGSEVAVKALATLNANRK